MQSNHQETQMRCESSSSPSELSPRLACLRIRALLARPTNARDSYARQSSPGTPSSPSSKLRHCEPTCQLYPPTQHRSKKAAAQEPLSRLRLAFQTPQPRRTPAPHKRADSSRTVARRSDLSDGPRETDSRSEEHTSELQ